MIQSIKAKSDWKIVAVMFFFLAPFFRPTIVNDWIALSPVKLLFALWLLAACVAAIARFVVRNGRVDLFCLGLALMLITMFISTLLTYAGSVYDAVINTAMLLSAALVVTTLKKDEVRVFFTVLVGILFVLVISELILRFLLPQGIYAHEGRARWILENGSLQSRWCFVLVFAAAALDSMRKGKYGLLSYASMAASLLLVLQLRSAVSIVAFASEALIIIFAGSSRLQRALTCRKVNVIFFVLVLAIVFFGIADYLPYDSIASFFGKDLQYTSGATFTGRTYIWESVISSISKSPLFGYGYQEFVATDLSQFYSQREFDSAHNLWLQVAFQGGFIGLAFFFLLYFSSCSKVDATEPDRARVLFLGLLIAFLVTSIFENTLNSALILALAIPASNVMLEMVGGCGSLSDGDDCGAV